MADIAAALRRVETLLRRRPTAGLQPDTPTLVRWDGGTRVTSTHANGTTFTTDMPEAMGGEGRSATPGWLFRAGLASCVATKIAMDAAVAGIQLQTLEIEASSRSDTRGLLEMTDTHGEPVTAGPCDVQLRVRIAAGPGVSSEQLRALVLKAQRSSPTVRALEDSTPIDLQIEVASV